jgi:hypothetical protein
MSIEGHTYARRGTPSPSIDTYRFRRAEDVVAYAACNPSVGAATNPEVWHLDQAGAITCYYKASTLDTLEWWANEPWPLHRSREEGLRNGNCGRDWVIVDSRPRHLRRLRRPVCVEDIDWFEDIRESLDEVGVNLVDAVVFDDACHWWSMRELAYGSTDWWAGPLPGCQVS